MENEAVLTGWYIGFFIGLIVISAVVVLVAIILALARRIGTQAVAVTDGLDAARYNTQPLWEVERLNQGLRRIVQNAERARNALGG